MTTVLIVDDDLELRIAMSQILEGVGYECIQAEDGKVGLAILESGEVNIDVLILDIMMPNVDGIEVLTRLLQEEGEKTIKVLAVSGGSKRISSELGLTTAKALGVSEILYKPFSRDELISSVERLVPSK